MTMEIQMETRKPGLTIVAAVLCFLYIVFFVFLVVGLFLPYTPAFIVVIIGCPILAISSIVLAVLAKKERKKQIWVVFLVADLLMAAASFGAIYPLHTVKFFYGALFSQGDTQAQQRVDMEYVKTLLPEKGLTLHTEETEKSSYRIFDDDGEIVKKFIATSFTLECESSCAGLSSTYFELRDDVTVTFTSDYNGVVVHAMYGMFMGYTEAYRTYVAVHPEDIQAIHQMIDDKVASQKEAYDARAAEVIATTSLSSALDAMDETNAAFQITLLDEEKYEVGLTRENDDDKLLLQALRELDESRLASWAGGNLTYKRGFYYESFNHSDYYLVYHADEHALRIVRSYEGVYGGKSILSVAYALYPEDGDHLMEVAESVVAAKERE